MYIHEHKAWSNFTWDQERVTRLLADTRHFQGRLLGRMETLGFSVREEATLQSMTLDVLKTSEIEGLVLDVEQVRSSIARRLGIDIGISPHVARNVEGIVEVMMDAVGNYNAPLTSERLFGWHAALFPTGRSGMRPITVGAWRGRSSGPMQVVSGPVGREKVHFEAPDHGKLEAEMGRFIRWFNNSQEMDLILKSSLAHFWFITLHPFDDGNGRIARAISDLLVAKSEQSSQRFYSMSAQIQKERNAYYQILEKCQKGTPEINLWIEWFLGCLRRAVESSEETLEAILNKARFWKHHNGKTFNKRQSRMINRLLNGFEGKLTSSKWAKIQKCSQDTALRDINNLLKWKILEKEHAGGRSTSYVIRPTEKENPWY